MPIDEGWQLVKDAFQKTFVSTPAGGGFDYSRFPLQDLCAPAIQRIQAQGTVFAQPGCGKSGQVLGYGQYPNGAWSHELIFWHISLMFVEYIAGVFKDKAKDGHCYAHQKPCADSRKFHLDILRRYKGCLEALVKEIEEIETKEAPTWPPATPAHPTGGPTTAGT